MGMAMLILSVFALSEGLMKIPFMKVSGFLVVSYCTWAIGHFFDKKKVVSYLKAFTSYVLGMLTFSASAILLGYLIDLFIKH
jgi:hypothetical protein